MLKNHYGIYVDSEKPVTGVISNNSAVQFISDEMHDGINLNYLEFAAQATEEELDDYEDRASDTWLIGDWKLVDDKYEPDTEGEYAAIVGEIETQVAWSKYTRLVNLCSPCFPGQGDLDSVGQFLAYDLPPEARDE